MGISSEGTWFVVDGLRGQRHIRLAQTPVARTTRKGLGITPSQLKALAGLLGGLPLVNETVAAHLADKGLFEPHPRFKDCYTRTEFGKTVMAELFVMN